MSHKCITINSYHLLGYSRENIELFYDEVEINLCGGLNSRFGRNYDALFDLFSGNFGILRNASSTNRFHIHIRKSRLLEECVKQYITEFNEENKFIKIFLE
jgi:hypothetical protein